ncbi:hypothetical protein [Modestobacter sp. I12A-02662]|uniref:hypothetical protein n=1 Tax=Modestobacter sp. I12A-02662 TaxID=1730496 RepID=UPI0034DF1E49
MDFESCLALGGIASVLIGTACTLYGIFAAPHFLTYATFEAGHRDVPLQVAISQKYSRPVPPYTLEDVRIAQREADLEMAAAFMRVAAQVDAARAKDLRSTQRWAGVGILLIALGSVAQGGAVLMSA